MLEFREGELTSSHQHDVLFLQRMKEDAAMEIGTDARKAKGNTLGFSYPEMERGDGELFYCSVTTLGLNFHKLFRLQNQTFGNGINCHSDTSQLVHLLLGLAF